MKQEEAKRILKQHDFDVDELDMIWYKSDRVGDISGALVTLADYIPSIRYAQTMGGAPSRVTPQ